jgi:twitching motility protein PilT
MDEQTLHMLLSAGIKHGASDIHLRVGDPPMYRVNGVLAPLKYDKLRPADTQELCNLLVRDPRERDKLGEVQELDTSFSLSGVGRFRVNIFRQRGTLSIVLRVIPTSVPSVQELGLPPVLDQIAESERGLVLVTGATGSGKSTTLAAMIRHVNETRRCHVLTIEDPIEFLHRGITASISQREVGVDTRSFTVALRAALRQDPDVILVGEMRDPESIDIALKASETGHMVFSTVHTTDAAKTIHRLVSVFPSEEQQTIRYRLADCLHAVVSQRLVARADGAGRVVAAEIMVVTKTVQECLRDPAQLPMLKDLIEKSRHPYQMQSFDQHLTELYKAGVITLETALEASSNPGDFQRALHFQ